MSLNNMLDNASPEVAARAAIITAQATVNERGATETARRRAQQVLDLGPDALAERIRAARTKSANPESVPGITAKHPEIAGQTDDEDTVEDTWRKEADAGDSGAQMAVFIAWDEVVRGRERRALRVYDAVREYLDGLQNYGEITSYEVAVLGPASRLGGFIVVRGSEDQLIAVRRTKGFRRLMLRVRLVVEHLRVARAFVGEELLEQIRDYKEEIYELED